MKHIYKKAESGNLINIRTMKQEIDQDDVLSRLDDTSRDINPYTELIVNNAKKTGTIWSNGTVVNIKQHSQLHTIW